MKKLIIPMLMLCIGHAGIVSAADTDVSAIDNVIYIEPFQASPGTTALELSIKMKNTAAIRGFQFDLVLPKGITPTEEDEEYVYWLNADRAPKKGGGQLYHTIEVTKQSDGCYRFLCGAQADKTFKGNDGEVAVVQIDIAADMEVGEYPIYLRTVKLTETDISKHYETEEVETSVSVCPTGYKLLDETSTNVPKAATNANVYVKRTVNADTWSTICLPFAMTAAQMKTAFGNGVQLADFTSWNSEEEGGAVVGITVGFTSATEIVANHPYIIKVTDKVTAFTVDGVDISPVEEAVCQVGEGTTLGSMYGTYIKKKVPAENLFLNGGQFWYSTGATTTKAFRAYFQFHDVLAAYNDGGAASRINISFNDETDGIRPASVEAQQAGYIYNLEGRPVEDPGKGIYIRNGKKVVVK